MVDSYSLGTRPCRANRAAARPSPPCGRGRPIATFGNSNVVGLGCTFTRRPSRQNKAALKKRIADARHCSLHTYCFLLSLFEQPGFKHRGLLRAPTMSEATYAMNGACSSRLGRPGLFLGGRTKSSAYVTWHRGDFPSATSAGTRSQNPWLLTSVTCRRTSARCR